MSSSGGGTGKITVRPINGRRELKLFMSLPSRLYRNDPNWIEPLRMEIRDRLSTTRNPYFEHAEACYWIAYRGHRPVGRISAQVDQLVIKHHGARTGHFGMLEAEDDARIFAALFAAAEEWLRARGMTQAVGPFNLSINQESGLLIDGFDTPPMMLMGHALPYYAPRVSEQGYAKVKDLYAYWFDVVMEMPPLIRRLIDRMERRGEVTLRPLDMRHYRRDLADIIDIFNEAWSDNWGYLPLTGAEAKKDIKDMKLLIREELVQIAEIDGRPVGMMITLPNLNEAIADLKGRLLPFGWAKLAWRLKVKCPTTTRVVMMGIRKKYQGTSQGAGIAFMLIERSRINAERLGMKWGELSWILEDNYPMRKLAEAMDSPIYKTYRLYAKTLPAAPPARRAGAAVRPML